MRKAHTNCPSCHARNSPVAMFCHRCEAELPEPAAFSEPASSTWGALARAWSIPALASVVLLGAVGGGWLGEWYVRQSPTAPFPTATPGPTVVPVATPNTVPTPAPTVTPSDATVEAVARRYKLWKLAHGISQEAVMEFYSPDARLTFTSNLRDNGQLNMSVLVRRDQMNNGVFDTDPIRYSQNSYGQVILRARHKSHPRTAKYYRTSSGRELVWEKRNNQWLIVDDLIGIATYSGSVLPGPQIPGLKIPERSDEPLRFPSTISPRSWQKVHEQNW